MKKTTTRRALFMSFVSLLLCMSMLLGTTYAWFTDSVTSSANMIVAGNLDVELEYKNVIDGAAATDWSPVTTDTDDLFDKNALWEPGHTEVAYLKVSNLGSLNLKYQLSVRVAEEIAGTNVAGESFKLSDYLVFTVVDLDESEIGTIDRAAAKAAGNTMGFDDYNGTIKALDAKDGNVVDADYVALIVYMPETVGNEANYKVGTTAPQIKLGINLFATQVEAEKDSFDEFYDKESPIVSTSVSAAIPAAGTTATENKVIETTVENNVALTLSAEFLNTFAALYEDEAVEAPKSVAVSHSEPKIDTANKTVTFENIDLVDENGNVIDLEDLGNDKPITVKFNVGDAFEVGQTVLVYHNGEVVASPAVDANKNITYTVTHFCEVAVAFNDGKIDTAKEFLATVAAVEDGDVITLAGDIVFNKEDRSWNSGTWYDGLYYIGDKSFTIDLAGYTITQDGSVNDYLLNFKNDGEKANEITIKNGTLITGKNAYCALCTSGGSTQQITINTENLTMTGKISNGSVAKIRGGAVLNAKAGTVIIGEDSYLAIETVNATVNIYDGAEIYMNGTTSYNGCLVGACGGGTVNVYGGYGKGAKGGFIAMTSGGTINVYGGEWIANTDGSIGNNSNLYVLTAQSNAYESGFVGPAIINVYGGTLRGGMDAWVLNNLPTEKAELNISGGNFNVNPASYLDEGCVAFESNGVWTVGSAAVTTADELKAAITNAEDGDVIMIANDITVDSDWDNRYGGKTAKNVTIDGLGNTLTFTGKMKDPNYSAAFRFESAKVVIRNLTIDMSAATGNNPTQIRAISAKNSLVVDNCTFIGNTAMTNTRAIIFGEGHRSLTQYDAEALITNCTFVNWTKGVTDNENASDIKAVTVSNNIFENASLAVSAYESVVVADNTMNNGYVKVVPYTAPEAVTIVITGNTLDLNQGVENSIGHNRYPCMIESLNVQDGFTIIAK